MGFLYRYCDYELRQQFLLDAKTGKGTVGMFEHWKKTTENGTASWRELWLNSLLIREVTETKIVNFALVIVMTTKRPKTVTGHV
jgi:hypothetical protein